MRLGKWDGAGQGTNPLPVTRLSNLGLSATGDEAPLKEFGARQGLNGEGQKLGRQEGDVEPGCSLGKQTLHLS